MIRNIDKRQHDFNRATTERSAALESFAADASDAMPGDGSVHVRRLNAMTGSPARLDAENAQPAVGNLIDAALQQVRLLAQPLGFEAAGPLPEFVPDPHIQETGAKVSIVHLHQRHRGIPVFQMTRSVQFTADRRPRTINGDHAPIADGVGTTPQLPIAEAVRAAAAHVAQSADSTAESDVDQFGEPHKLPPIDLSRFQPEVIAAFNDPQCSTVFACGPFARPIKTHLVLFYTGPETRLGWLVTLTLPEFTGEYALIIAADNQQSEILYCQPLSHHMALGRGNIYEESPGRTPRRLVDFPRPITDYPTVLTAPPDGFPAEWVDQNEAVGNNVRATLGASTVTLSGTQVEDRVIFDPEDETGDDQKILNIFYFCNFAHDFFELLGFDEAAGNFQLLNPSGTGAAGDRVLARAHSGTVTGTANMLTPSDGEPPLMNMGLVDASNRHTAFDIDVVLHEFTHGVSNRLVGGRMDRFALQSPQSRSMGEGWSDYFALTIQNVTSDTEKVVTGDWVVDNNAGIRGFPYNSQFPDGFGSIGTGRYNLDFLGRVRVHNIGEIWCATLMEMTRRAVNEVGNQQRAYAICWQSVMDGLKLTAANPSFLDARDAILQALDDLQESTIITADEHAQVRSAAWRSFAQFGMGTNASSNGPALQGVVADDSLPDDL